MAKTFEDFITTNQRERKNAARIHGVFGSSMDVAPKFPKVMQDIRKNE